MTEYHYNRRQLMAATAALPMLAAASDTNDIAIIGGRVMDPESGRDGIANLLIRSGRIAEVTQGPVKAARRIDAAGLVVAPGFIDLHVHGMSPLDTELQAHDGVTTALELEAGIYPIADFLARRSGRSRINFGASVGHFAARQAQFAGVPPILREEAGLNALVPTQAPQSVYTALDPAGIARLAKTLDTEIGAGGLGIGLVPEYIPAASHAEILAMFDVAAARKACIFTHVRRSNSAAGDGPLPAMEEMLANAAASGAGLHICHVGSKAKGAIEHVLALVNGARTHGLAISTEVYPYTAASTGIGSALFDTGFQDRIGASYADLEWPATGERLTEDSFNRYRSNNPGGLVIIHNIAQRTVDIAMADRNVMVASDGVSFVNGRGHPRGAGSFARTLGVYVRERRVLTLMDALRKISLLPAQRLRDFAPAMRNKGRIKPGADADLTIFDPQTVIDRATFAAPATPSTGILHVLVNGVPVVANGATVIDSVPGRAIRSKS